MNNLNTDSLITKDASTAIKGLLMLLIVFGHTGMLTTNFSTDEKTFLYDWLYTFHVHIFLIMPFIYGYKQKTSKGYAILNDLKHNLVKIGAPYFWFFLLYTLVFITVGGGKLNLSGIIYAFFFGSQTLMSKYIGFNMMWFLPAMLALVTLKSVWYNSQTVVRNCLLTISIILWLFCIFRIVEMGEVGLYIPFGPIKWKFIPIWQGDKWNVRVSTALTGTADNKEKAFVIECDFFRINIIVYY